MTRPLWKNPLAMLLAVSLGANAFIGARAVGHWMTEPERAGPPAGRGFERYLSATTPEIRSRVREIRGARETMFRERRSALREARETRRLVLTAESFDPVAFRKASDQVLSARSRLREVIDDGFVELLQELPVEERRRLADALRRRPPR